MALKDYLWLIGAAIYVGGMFPMFYTYQFNGDTTFGLVDILATFGGFLVMFGQAFVSFMPDKKEPAKPKE